MYFDRMIAPFGFHDDVSTLYSTNEESSELLSLKSSFQQWEEVISRHIFKSYNVNDDQIAASFHQYLEVEKDASVSSYNNVL